MLEYFTLLESMKTKWDFIQMTNEALSKIQGVTTFLGPNYSRPDNVAIVTLGSNIKAVSSANAMKLLTTMADEHKVTLKLTVRATTTSDPSQSYIIDWYEDYGFSVEMIYEEENIHFVRNPR